MRQAGTQIDREREGENEGCRESVRDATTEPKPDTPLRNQSQMKQRRTTKATLYKQQSQFAMQMTFY